MKPWLFSHIRGMCASPFKAMGAGLMVAMVFLVAACGGGGGGGSASAASAPSSYTLSVSATGTGSNSVTSSVGGIACVAGNTGTCTASVASGTTVTLTAVTVSGYTFGGWSGACSGTSSTCVVAMSANQTVSASFTATVTYQLTATRPSNGSIVASTVSGVTGINCGTTCGASYPSGTVVTLTATPAVGYAFSSWGGTACSGVVTATCTVTMSAAKAVTASFATSTATYVLSTSITGSGLVTSSTGGISCSTGNAGTCSSSGILSGTSVTLTAAAISGYGFTGWSGGGCSGTSTTCTLTITSATSVAATFAANALSVTVAGGGSGTVTSSPSGISCSSGTCTASYASGTSVTLTATPGSGSTFSGWTGACTSTSSTCTTVMSVARSATATFAVSSGSACTSSGSFTLANVVRGSGSTVSPNTINNEACAADDNYQRVNGRCYGSYAVQPNIYATPNANTSFSMWSNSASCWGINITDSVTDTDLYWNAPQVTRGFSFGFQSKMISTGGILVSSLNTTYSASSTPCPTTGTSGGVCAKWAMSVPGVAASSQTNTASVTCGKWNALMDIYFHGVAIPGVQAPTTFDLQIYQMLMDNQAGGNPNWSDNIVGQSSSAKKTIGGITYLVSANMQDPGTEDSGWVGRGGSYNAISMFPLPTYRTTTPANSGSYLWGQASLTHDIAGIIKWLSVPTSGSSGTGIYDDAGVLLYDNVRNANITSAFLSPSMYLTGFNPGYEVVGAVTSSIPANCTGGANNTVFTTTNFWVATPGETMGN